MCPFSGGCFDRAHFRTAVHLDIPVSQDRFAADDQNLFPRGAAMCDHVVAEECKLDTKLLPKQGVTRLAADRCMPSTPVAIFGRDIAESCRSFV